LIYDVDGNAIMAGSGGTGVYSVEPFISDDQQSLVPTFNGVIALYDALVTAYPEYVTKNTMTQGSITNYEYVFTTGAYNNYSSHAFAMDASTPKPKFLIASGIHGNERTAPMANYVFFKSLCEGKNGLKYLREAIEFRTIPIVNAYGFDHDIRYNQNGVDLNRNFDSNWITQGSPYYSGTSAASEDETKLVQAWLTANSDAKGFIDHHNSEVPNELCLIQSIGRANVPTKMKHNALQCGNRIITHWKLDRQLPSTTVFFYTGVDSTGKGMMSHYADDNGIPSFILETSWNVNSTGKHSAETIGTSAETEAITVLGMCAYIDATVFAS